MLFLLYLLLPAISLAQGMQIPGANPRSVSPDAKFAGSRACGACHTKQSKAHATAPMTRALETAASAEILRTHPRLTYSSGKYKYEITRERDRSFYSVTDGSQTIKAPIQWAFGLGAAGQTYVFEHNGKIYESRLSYYESIKGLDLTMGASNTPATLDEAIGRRMDADDARDCFGCHSTGGVRANQLHTDKLIPGIACEGCHGPAAEHVAKRTQMPSLRKHSSEDMSEFCGSCHRTWAQVAAANWRGPNNVRFQPYRLANSKCYDVADRRISCTACHDPHAEVVRSSAAYDAACNACHNQFTRKCSVGKTECASCHMPKIDLPGAHFRFTDHQIRIVRPGEPYPN